MEVREVGRKGRWLAGIFALLAVCLAMPAVATATPARFTYELCDSALPGGNPPAFDFHANPGVAYAPFQNCASPGGAVGVTETGQVTTNPGWIDIGVLPTPGGFVEAETITASASGLQPGQEASHVFAEGWPLNSAGDSPRYFHLTSVPLLFGNGGGFNVVMTCSTTCNAGGVIGAHYIAVTEVDPTPPTVSKVEGPILVGGVLRGHQGLSAAASDVGGGLSRLEVLVNGIAAPGVVPGSCAVAQVKNPSYEGLTAVSPSPCPSSLTGTWDLDTTAYPFHGGANTVSVCASDFATAGLPNTTCSPPATVAINNSCVESAAPGGQVLSAQFAHSNSEAVTVPYGHGAAVTGNLADGAGDPISGATICVEAQRQGTPGEPHPIAVATTGVNGEFAYEAPPGPDRRLLFGYRRDSFQVARTLTLGTHARPSLKLSAGRVDGGDRIKITGKLPGPDAAGRVLVVQASSLHGRWLTFRRATTGPRGGFRANYRFQKASKTITYRIRALVPAQAGYSYEPGASKPKRIKVRG